MDPIAVVEEAFYPINRAKSTQETGKIVTHTAACRKLPKNMKKSALSNDVTPSRGSTKPKILNEPIGKMNSSAGHLPYGPSTALVR